MKLKNRLIENFVTSCELLERRSSDKDLIIGTEEYSRFLQQIIDDLKTIKSSLRTRSTKGKANRKEADRIQAAVNALKYLSGKSQRILNNGPINEKLTRDDIKSFLRKSYESE